jgi:hypothetical protein
VYNRAGVPTKHFTQQQLMAAVVAAGLHPCGGGSRPAAPERVSYSWSTEFSPPLEARGGAAALRIAEQLGPPYPFDWLVLATLPPKAARPNRGAEGGGTSGATADQLGSLPRLCRASLPAGVRLCVLEGASGLTELRGLNERALPMRYPQWFYDEAYRERRLCAVARSCSGAMVGAIVCKLEPDHDLDTLTLASVAAGPSAKTAAVYDTHASPTPH